jgi:hypothetical protein
MQSGEALRASSFTLMALCSVYIVLAAVCWVVAPPVAYDARGFIMLLAASAFGLFVFHGLGLWVTLFGPRRCDPDKTMGNDLSLLGNVVLIGGMITMLMGPMIVGEMGAGLHKKLIGPDQWWIMVALAIMAACFYFGSLRAATALFSSRRERLLRIVEGKA